MSADLVSARDISERIKAKLRSEGIEWQRSNADGFTLGDPDARVRGIAVTFKPTMSVLAEAVARGTNLLISHEATFWDGFDSPQLLSDDPIRRQKIAFARDHDLVVWRMHDHMHRIDPEPIFDQLIRRLGWASSFAGLQDLHRLEIDGTTLEALATHIQDRLDTANVSVVGDPSMVVRSVGFGVHGLSTVLPALNQADVAIVGETGEYDTYEYVRDAVALGQRRALIRIAHQRLEEWGVAGFAEWLRPLVPGLPLDTIDAGDPFIVPDLTSSALTG
ncbi:Nif3-like dinuclear metal center hexameric protein [Microbacterium sp. E-13]|uniref:Nif3-like dinuclear metal center hexameric protein n=1 Tax=Microbacterium sp. E-13 TaxID=3404048 RepID=UPI003CE881EB